MDEHTIRSIRTHLIITNPYYGILVTKLLISNAHIYEQPFLCDGKYLYYNPNTPDSEHLADVLISELERYMNEEYDSEDVDEMEDREDFMETERQAYAAMTGGYCRQRPHKYLFPYSVLERHTQ